MPEPTPSDPSVVAGPADAADGDEPEPADEPVVRERPSTEAALPVVVTGAETGTTTWLPDAAERCPEVRTVLAAGEAPEAPDPAVDPVDPADAELAGRAVERPRTATPFPVAVTGTAAGTTTWLPDSTPCCPVVVSSACATPAPTASSPPARTPARSNLDTTTFMDIS